MPFLLEIHSLTFLQFSFRFIDLPIWIWAGQKLHGECSGLVLNRSPFYFRKHLKILTVKFWIHWSQYQNSHQLQREFQPVFPELLLLIVNFFESFKMFFSSWNMHGENHKSRYATPYRDHLFWGPTPDSSWLDASAACNHYIIYTANHTESACSEVRTVIHVKQVVHLNKSRITIFFNIYRHIYKTRLCANTRIWF